MAERRTDARRGGPGWQMASDVLRFSWSTRSWAMLLLLLVGLAALAVGLLVQVALPWTIYPFV